MSGMIPVGEALDRVLASVTSPLRRRGRRARRRAWARARPLDRGAESTQPPFANRRWTVMRCGPRMRRTRPAMLALVGESAAAAPSRASSGPDRRCGSSPARPMPDGADTIVIQEDVKREATAFCSGRRRLPATICAMPGSTSSKERRCFAPGGGSARATSRSPPRPIIRRCRCAASARVAILATGDELRAARRNARAGADRRLERFRGRRARLRRGRRSARPRRRARHGGRSRSGDARAQDSDADVLVTLGGASVGDYDLVQKTLVGLGMELGFWRIAMRPGKPLMHGKLGRMLVLGLPGNPTSSMVCAILFLRPCFAHCMASRSPARIRAASRFWAPTSAPTAPVRTICALPSSSGPTAVSLRRPSGSRIRRW